MQRKKVALLGSTGSIGTKAIFALKELSNLYRISAITGHSNTALLSEQALELKPDFVGITGERRCDMPADVTCAYGKESLIEACTHADIVLLAVVGIAGLPAFEYCLKNNIPVALATKEAMVCGGRLARDLMDKTQTPVLPIDSELSAIFQCLLGNRKKDVRSIWLTASGGPFRDTDYESMCRATPAQALKHPNWSMGAKISVDSATLMNKGLEIMETRWLFDIPAGKIKVVIHPESLVHSMVEYVDGSLISMMAVTDMQLAIHYAMSYPRRLPSSVHPLNLCEVGALHFREPDTARFPCLELAYEAVKSDGYLQLVLNSANEVAVDLFLKEKIAFMGIPRLVELAMNKFNAVKLSTFEEIYEVDREVRAYVLKQSYTKI